MHVVHGGLQEHSVHRIDVIRIIKNQGSAGILNGLQGIIEWL